MYKNIVIIIPINAKRGAGEVKLPKVRILALFFTMIPAFFKPINARKNPIPPPVPNCKSFGIIFIIFSLRPIIVTIKKMTDDIKTAARVALQLHPIDLTTVIAKNAFIAIPGAILIGNLEIIPITIHARPDARAVERNTLFIGIPICESIVEFTPNI